MRKTIDIASLIFLLGVSLAAAQEPAAPAGLRGSLTSFQRAFTLTWEETGGQDVAGYNIYRRTQLDGAATRINADPVTVRTFADRVDGQTFYYTVRAIDASGHESADSATIDSSADCNLIFSAADGGASVFVPASAAGVFPSFGNSLGVPLALRVSETSPSSRDVMRDVSIVFVRADTGEEINEVGFGRSKVRVRIGYAATLASAAGGPTPRASLYWYNGFSWIRAGASASPDAVELETAQVGRFQLRAEAGADAANGAKVYPTVITPNGDGLNDRAFVMLDGSESGSGEVFDRFGRRVAGLRETTVAGNAALSWDGRDDAGNPVGSDLYVIRVVRNDGPMMATVAVAR